MKKPQHGVALVEFTLMLPFLLLLTFITTEFGRALYQYNTLAKSVRDAARYLSVQSPGADITQAAQNLVVYGKPNPGPGDPPVAQGLSTSNVPAPTWQQEGANPIINTVTIQVTNYGFQPMVSSVLGIPLFPNGVITFPDIRATMRSHV